MKPEVAIVFVFFVSLVSVASALRSNSRWKENNACEKPDAPPAFDDSEYYAAALAASGASELRAALEEITSRDYIRYSYSCVWELLEDIDEDPSNSSNVILVYTEESFPKYLRDTGTEPGGVWNREHLWAKSHGFPNEGDEPYTDVTNLFPCEKQVNSYKNDKDFVDGGNYICLLPYGESQSDCAVSTYGTTSTFEVPDFHKGVIARSLFYMEIRWADSYDLELTNESTYQTGQPWHGNLCALYEWHQDFSVSSEEKNRNEKVYSWQYNRNPFIDHPEWVDDLWGDACNDRR